MSAQILKAFLLVASCNDPATLDCQVYTEHVFEAESYAVAVAECKAFKVGYIETTRFPTPYTRVACKAENDLESPW